MKNDKLFACTEVNGVELRQKIKVWHAFAVRKTEGLRKSDLVNPLSADQVQNVHLISRLSREPIGMEALILGESEEVCRAVHDLGHAIGVSNGVEERGQSDGRHEGGGVYRSHDEVVLTSDGLEKWCCVAVVAEGFDVGGRFTFSDDENDVFDFRICETLGFGRSVVGDFAQVKHLVGQSSAKKVTEGEVVGLDLAVGSLG